MLLKADHTLPALFEILPQSIEEFNVKHLEILETDWVEAAKQLLSGLPSMQKFYLPSPRHVVFAFGGTDAELTDVISFKHATGT